MEKTGSPFGSINIDPADHLHCPHSAAAVDGLADSLCKILDRQRGFFAHRLNKSEDELRSLGLHLRDVLKHYVSLLKEDNEIDVPHYSRWPIPR